MNISVNFKNGDPVPINEEAVTLSTLPQAEVDATREKWEAVAKQLRLSFKTLGGIAEEINKQAKTIADHPLIQREIKRMKRQERALKRSRTNTQHKRFKHGRQCRTR